MIRDPREVATENIKKLEEYAEFTAAQVSQGLDWPHHTLYRMVTDELLVVSGKTPRAKGRKPANKYRATAKFYAPKEAHSNVALCTFNGWELVYPEFFTLPLFA